MGNKKEKKSSKKKDELKDELKKDKEVKKAKEEKKSSDDNEKNKNESKKSGDSKKDKKTSKNGKLDNDYYMEELEKLQTELVYLQYWVKEKGLKIAIIFEGRDAAGKGGSIKRVAEALNPRTCKVVALPVPTEREKSQWYFQRYVSHLPAAGEIVLFDRSWYNRAGVEKVLGFCNDDQYDEFMRSCPEFENMLLRSGIILLKYWFSVSDDEQEKRFLDRLNEPRKRWKISETDFFARTKWVDYSKAKDKMFEITDTKTSPWFVVESDDKKRARLNFLSHFLSMIPYKKNKQPELKLPPVQKKDYKRPPKSEYNYVPNKY